MQKTITLDHYPDVKDLGNDIQTLIAQSQKANSRAYAPYSRFKIGAAVSLANGAYVLGCNQENRSFPAGLCAERVALYAAGAQYPETHIQSMAIYCEALNDNEMITPCGGCRQVMFEFEQKQDAPFSVYLCNGNASVWMSPSAENLLPFPFVSAINGHK